MNVAFASAKRGGVTTATLAIAAVWPERRRVIVVEADPSGGDVAIRFGVPAEPGLVSLAAAGRRGLSVETLVEHAQRLPGGLEVVAAPPSAERAHAAVRALGDSFGQLSLGDAAVDVFLDCGRLAVGSPAEAVVAHADLTILVARPTAEEVAHLEARVHAMRSRGRSLVVLLVGEKPYGAREIGSYLDAVVLGALPDDVHGARMLAGGGATARSLARTPLLVSAAVVANRLIGMSGRLSAPAPGPASSSGNRVADGGTPVVAGDPPAAPPVGAGRVT